MGENKTGIIILIIVFVLLAGGGSWYWFKLKPEQEAKEKARQEQLAQEEAEKKRQEARKARYEALMVDAKKAFDNENWQTANDLYTEATGLFPNEQFPKNQLELISAKLDEIAALEARKAAGVVERIGTETGRYYIIVSSSIDDDLAMDYATRLAKEGNIVKLLEPNNTTNKLFHRVSLADYSTLEEAEAATSSFSHYGEGVWVLRY